MTDLAKSSITQQTISQEGVRAILAGTPLAAQADFIWQLGQRYGLDCNWALTYIQWESGFLRSQIAAYANNPFDILQGDWTWGVVDYYSPGNGFTYAVFPSPEVGLESGFKLFSGPYIREGYDIWEKALARALCGNLGCVDDPWVRNVIAQGEANAAEYPYAVPPPPPPKPPGVSSVGALLLGVATLLAAAGVLYVTTMESAGRNNGTLASGL